MKKRIVIISSILVITISIVLIYCYYSIKPTIYLNGEDNITINYNDNYNDMGAKSYILGKDYSSRIKIDGEVNTNKVGTYEIKYIIKVNYLKRSNYVTRKITVVDKEAPIINLKGEKEINIKLGSNYEENGFSAEDNVDGNITDKVKITNNIDKNKVGKYEVIYTVTDSSNNTSNIVRYVNVIEKKSIKLDKYINNNIKQTNVKTQNGTGHGIPILMYHYFYDKNKGEKGKDNNWMEIHKFEEQLKYLVQNNYYFPTWDEVKDFVEGKKDLPSKSVVITIDDGHASLFDLAIPIINKYKVKATAFIITSKSAGTKYKEYKSDYINFQSHTHNMHKAGCTGGRGGLFRCISYSNGINDLKESISILDSSDAIAYPFGDITDNSLKITKDVGFKVGVTIKYGRAKKGMDPLQLPRVRMLKDVSLDGFIGLVK